MADKQSGKTKKDGQSVDLDETLSKTPPTDTIDEPPPTVAAPAPSSETAQNA